VGPESPALAPDLPLRISPGQSLAGAPSARIDPPLAGEHPHAAPASFDWSRATLVPLPVPERHGVTVRELTLNESFDDRGRLLQTLGTNVARSPADFGLPYSAPPTETPEEGDTEVWQIANLTGDTHPIHFHLVNAQVLSRRPFDVDAYLATPVGAVAVPAYVGPARGPDATELGWKETIKMNPGEVTTVIMRFDLPAVPFAVPPSPRTGGDEYVWHCHILEHEEHDMMRPLVVQPGPGKETREQCR
jgi:spore coat protein A